MNPLLQLASAVLLLGGAWPLTRYAVLQGAGPAWFALGRAGLSGLAALTLLGVLGRLRWPVWRDGPALLALGVLQLAGFFALSHAAVAWVPAGRTALLANAALIPAVPLSVLVLHERISPRRWLAAAFGLCGILVLISPWAIPWSAPHILLGCAMLLGAATCWAAAIVVIRRWPPPMGVMALLPWGFGLATLLLAGWALGEPMGAWPWPASVTLAGIGLIAGPLGTWCVIEAQQRLPVVVAGLGFLMIPAAGVVLSTVWLGERLSWDIVMGSILIMGGAAMALKR